MLSVVQRRKFIRKRVAFVDWKIDGRMTRRSTEGLHIESLFVFLVFAYTSKYSITPCVNLIRLGLQRKNAPTGRTDHIDHDLDHVGQTDQTDHDLDQTYHIDQIYHDLDHVDPSLPLSDVVQDLYATDQTQATRPRSCRLYDPYPETSARPYRSGSCQNLAGRVRVTWANP